MLKFVLVKMCPLIRSLSTVEPYMCHSFVGTYAMLGKLYSDIEMSHNQRFKFGNKHRNIPGTSAIWGHCSAVEMQTWQCIVLNHTNIC